MEKEMIDFMIKSNKYLSGGTKEACVKVREFLHYSSTDKDTVRTQGCSAVNAEEFVEAVKVLMASAFQREDEIPERWHCDSDCERITTCFFCKGEFNLNKESNKLCPFFVDEGTI